MVGAGLARLRDDRGAHADRPRRAPSGRLPTPGAPALHAGRQAQTNDSITADQGTLGQIVGSSQGAVGILQATQATNQLLELMAKQTMQSQQLRIAQDRPAALEQSPMLEADERPR